MTERELAICVMYDNLREKELGDPNNEPLTAKDMLDFINDLWALMQGNSGDFGEDCLLPVIVNTVTHRFYNPDEKLELKSRT